MQNETYKKLAKVIVERERTRDELAAVVKRNRERQKKAREMMAKEKGIDPKILKRTSRASQAVGAARGLGEFTPKRKPVVSHTVYKKIGSLMAEALGLKEAKAGSGALIPPGESEAASYNKQAERQKNLEKKKRDMAKNKWRRAKR